MTINRTVLEYLIEEFYISQNYPSDPIGDISIGCGILLAAHISRSLKSVLLWGKAGVGKTMLGCRTMEYYKIIRPGAHSYATNSNADDLLGFMECLEDVIPEKSIVLMDSIDIIFKKLDSESQTKLIALIQQMQTEKTVIFIFTSQSKKFDLNSIKDLFSLEVPL